ncbi:MAG TPA: carboxypeptidase M32 [Candidatus Bathyarchaeia archaeon]
MASNLGKAYNELLALTKDIIILQTTEGIVHWDMETKMPPKAVEQRSLQLALLSRITHRMSTDPKIGKLLKQISTRHDYNTFSSTEKRNIYLIKKNYEEQTALPEKLVSQIAKQQALTVNTWKKAKKTNKFSLLEPDLTKLLDLTKQKAEILMKVKEAPTAYDAMIDDFEPRMTQKKIAPIFDNLQKGLKKLLTKIQTTHNNPNVSILSQHVPPEKQMKIATTLAETLGYDTTSPNAAGRIDETEHPFTTGYYEDVRITTHYYMDNFASSIFSVLHETGHALYDQNLNQEWEYQPIGSHCSMGIHESQSRFAENLIGRSKEFWTFALPRLKQLAPELENLKMEQFIRAINKVEPSKIRVEADEVTYNLHIIIRFKIERDLFSDKIRINELPEIWNEKYHELLGLKIKNDAEGVMQDTHWPSGYLGYFPSYTLGNIYSGQLLDKINEAIPNWKNNLIVGDLKDVQNWLVRNVHNQGNLYDPEELIRKATGQELESKPYLNYLNEKYEELYGF